MNRPGYGVVCTFTLLLSLTSSFQAQTPPAVPAPSPSSKINPGAGDASDGKAFRILSRITKALAPSILFEGRIARSIVLGRAPSGATTICANCTDKRRGAAATTPGASTPVCETPLGQVLVMDTSNVWNPRIEDGAFVYTNDEGFDKDDREYEVFPAPAPAPAMASATITGLTGKLFWVCSAPKENQKSPADPARTFQLLMRRARTTYAAPIADNRSEPSKTLDGEPGSEDVREMARSHLKKSADWLPHFRPRFDLLQGASCNALSDAIAIFASSEDGFIMILNLRKLESKEASYFWAPYDHGQRIVLDQGDLRVDGGVEDDGYQPDTFVEYPYLIISGPYARLTMSQGKGQPPVCMVVGLCDECP